MEEPSQQFLMQKVQKIVQAEDIEEGTIVQTHMNYPAGIENADPEYFTKVMMGGARQEDLISTQEMSRILATTFSNATLVQMPQKYAGYKPNTAPKSPAFKKNYLGYRHGAAQIYQELNSVSENNMEESKSQIEVSIEGVSPLGFEANFLKNVQQSFNLEKETVVSNEIDQSSQRDEGVNFEAIDYLSERVNSNEFMAKNPLKSKNINQGKKQGLNYKANISPISDKVGLRRHHNALEEIVRTVS